MALDGAHKAADRYIVHRPQLFAFHSGQSAGVGGVKSKVPNGHGLLERFMKDAVDQVDRLGRKWLDVPRRRMKQVIIKCLNNRGGQRFQLDGTQGGLDVIFDIGLVGFRCSGLYMP